MILGRFSILGVFRHINEFSKQYNSPKRGIFYVGNVSLNKRRKLRERLYRELSVITSYARMASTSHEAGSHSLKKEKNKLAFEKSPYLLQHATNPVKWYPWGDEALEKARREDKLIFLSVGYSTCHWCHVMERESFENEEIAKIMNQFFVSIKVDREERPDIDKIYMTFIQAISGHGGWPMSVFLTPDLTPITGGTYFPPVDKYGQPGFKSVLLTVAHKWLEDKTDVLDSGRRVLDVLKRVVGTDKAAQDQEVPSSDCLHSCVKQLMGGYDKEYGGFTSSPKFPQPVNFNLLFHVYSKDKSSELGKECLNMCIHTLTKMAKGGIHDHVGQGFSRYSVDGKWHVPHFEKMLYDQAQLLRSYSEAFLATKDPFFSRIVDDIVTYVTRDLRHKEGGFYSAEDADSLPSHDSNAKKEGAFYVWSYGEVEALLSEAISGHDDLLLIDIFCHHFNVKPEGNLKPHQDPHREMEKQNVLIIYGSVEETAEHFKLSIEDTEKYLEDARKILFEARAERPRPHLDDKIITAWNGLMMSGLSYAGLAVKNEKYIEYAEDTARFIERYLFDEQGGLLLRSCYRGDEDTIIQIGTPILGFHVDYAFVVKGLLDLYEATFNVHWLEFAERLHDIQDGLFWDSKDGGYFASTKDDLTAILRLKDDHDGAEPSGNSVACENLLRLASYLNRPELNDKAARLLSSFQSVLTRIPAAVPELISALSLYHDTMTQIYIAGRKDAKDTDELLSVIRERLIPGRVLFFVDSDDSDNILFRKNEVMKNMKSSEGRTTVFVCRNRTCSLPITDRSQLVALLEAGK